VHAAQYSAQLSAADLENERLTEQSALASFFFEIRGQDALISLFAETAAQDQKALDLTQAQYDTGVGAYISVVQAKNTLESVQAQETNLRVSRAQFEHAIAVLIGKGPSEFSIPVRPLTTAPPPIPLGMPSQLLERRPDVAAAERNMASANAQIGVAQAAFYPNLTLTAVGGTQSSLLTHLLDWPSRFWSLGGSLSQPLFQVGLTAARSQFAALYNANVATYRQTVLTAFQQVEDSLAATRILSSQIEQQKQVVATSQEALDLEMSRYESGVDPYIDVVTLQNTLLTNRQTLTSLQITEMTSAITLVQALGGGWDRSQLPTPAEVSQMPSKADMAIQH
jgi:NodT family efflux transporter outer membrane factor (OMF) lipoprotein